MSARARRDHAWIPDAGCQTNRNPLSLDARLTVTLCCWDAWIWVNHHLKIKKPTYFAPALNGAGVLVNTAQEARGWFDTANPDTALLPWILIRCRRSSTIICWDVRWRLFFFGIEARRLRVYNRSRLRCMKDERNNGKSASTTVA